MEEMKPNVSYVLRRGSRKIVEDRQNAVEYTMIKRKLGLPDDATMRDVLDLIEGLIEVAEMYEGLCK